jgi:short-subunit dehydrogenase
VKVSCVCPGYVRTNVYRNAEVVNVTLPAGVSREKLAGAPAKMMEPSRAAQVILDGVARNKALIVFPASVRWLRRANQLFPGLIERGLLRQFLQRQQRVRAAWPVNLTSPRRHGSARHRGPAPHAVVYGTK